MKVIALGEGTALVELDGARRTVSTACLERLAVGEYVIVHAGFAIQVLDEAEAMKTIEMIRAITEDGS
jgi:hydrogenase expression/formation protein HypC